VKGLLEFQNQIEILTGLGLTNNQAKIYLVLVQSRPSSVAQIAKFANSAREVVYRTLPRLQELGLITKAISVPNEFEATPIDLAVKMLYERKIKETFEVKARADELVGKIKNKTGEEGAKEPQVISLSGKEHLLSFTVKHMLSIQKSLDTMIVRPVFPHWWETFHPSLKPFLQKNVRIRVIVACCKERMYVKTIEQFKKYPNFGIKFIPDQIKVGIGIIDNKDTLMNTLPGNKFKKASFYWSNDPGVIDLCSNYFEKHCNLPVNWSN
jgi:sugar-specific transcriptional regulator TrmB